MSYVPEKGIRTLDKNYHREAKVVQEQVGQLFEFKSRSMSGGTCVDDYCMSTFFSIVEHWGFRSFIRNLQLLFTIVSRETIKTDGIVIYEREKK